MRKFRLRDSSFISAISVALVLCLIGAECVLLLTAGALITRVREKMAIHVELEMDVETPCSDLDSLFMDQSRFTRYTFISKEEALEMEDLGIDPMEFFGFIPIPASYEVYPTELYSHPDSMAMLAKQLEANPNVDRVIYDQDLADKVSHNARNFTLILLVVALVLLLISLVLIVNTIRLQIYAKRFLINTMTLVGATPWVTRRPFVLRNMLMGFCAGLAALVAIGAIVYTVQHKMDVVLFPMTAQNICFIAGVVLGSGLLITFLASMIATGRYIRMDNNSLYEI